MSEIEQATAAPGEKRNLPVSVDIAEALTKLDDLVARIAALRALFDGQ